MKKNNLLSNNCSSPFNSWKGGADLFSPHEFRTQLICQSFEPTILITPAAYADMVAIAGNSGTDEIGWLGTVKVLADHSYLIDGIYMPAQQVHYTTNDLTEDGLGEYFTELAETNFDACERMHFWGHVHPSNNTSPTQQDEDQMELFKHNEWFLRGIFGRNGRAEFTFFDFENGVRWNDCAWKIHVEVSNELKAKWAAEVAVKVERMAIQTSPYQGIFGKKKFAQVVKTPEGLMIYGDENDDNR
jgi:hypothetical protein